MSETSGFINTQKKLSVNIDADFKKLFNRVADKLGLDSEDYGITDVITTALKKIDEKFNPKVSKKEDLLKIDELENDVKALEIQLKEIETIKKSSNNEIQNLENIIENLKKELSENKASDEESFKQYKELVETNKKNEVTILQLQEQLKGRIKLYDNQIILTLSEYQLGYLLAIIKDKKFVNFLKAQNQNGKLDGLIEPLIADQNTDIQNSLLGFFFYSAKLGKYPLISFNKWLKSNKG